MWPNAQHSPLHPLSPHPALSGRGTDIILGGSPKGLTRLVLMRLIYRRLLADAEEAEAVPLMPLSFFDAYDCTAAAPPPSSAPSAVPSLASLPQLSSYPRASDFEDLPETLRLPRDLHAALLGSVMLAAAKRLSAEAAEHRRGAAGGSGGGGGFGGDLQTYEEVSELLGWAMDQAYGMRQEVYRRLRCGAVWGIRCRAA